MLPLPELHTMNQGVQRTLEYFSRAMQWRFTEVVERYNLDLQKIDFFDFASGVGDSAKQIPPACFLGQWR